MDVSFIPEAQRALPVRRGGSSVSGSKGSLLWAWRTDERFRAAANNAITSRRSGALSDAASCTPETGAATRLVAVLSPRGGRALLERRLTAAVYPTIKVHNVSFKAHWLCWLVDHTQEANSSDDADIELLRAFLRLEVSHLCGKKGCMARGHTTLEAGEINVSRSVCHNSRITDMCPHNPPCIKTPVKKRRLG